VICKCDYLIFTVLSVRVQVLLVLSLYIYCTQSKVVNNIRARYYYSSIYSCGCEREGATPLRTRVRDLQYGLLYILYSLYYMGLPDSHG